MVTDETGDHIANVFRSFQTGPGCGTVSTFTAHDAVRISFGHWFDEMELLTLPLVELLA